MGDVNSLRQAYSTISNCHNRVVDSLELINQWRSSEPVVIRPTQLTSVNIIQPAVADSPENAISLINELERYLDSLKTPAIEHLNYPEAIQRAIEIPNEDIPASELILREILLSPQVDIYLHTSFGSPQLNQLINQNLKAIIPYLPGEEIFSDTGIFLDSNGKKWLSLINGKLPIDQEHDSYKFIKLGDYTIRVKMFDGKLCICDHQNLTWIRDYMSTGEVDNLSIDGLDDLVNFVFRDSTPNSIFVHPTRTNLVHPIPFLSSGAIKAIKDNGIRMISGDQIEGQLTLVNHIGRVRDAVGNEYITYSENNYIRILDPKRKGKFKVGSHDKFHSLSEFNGKYHAI